MLVDGHGETRGELNAASKGVAQIAVFERTGTLRARLGVSTDDAPALGIYGHDGKPRAEVGPPTASRESSSSTPMRPAQAALGITPDDKPGLGLIDNTGNAARLDHRATQRHSDLAPRRQAARGRIGMDLTPDRHPGLGLPGADGKTRASLPSSGDGVGALTLFDAAGNPINSVP